MSKVRDNPALNRFELDVEGGMAVAYYRATPGRITITHTEVPTELRGRGIGSVLVKGALDQVRSEGLKVVAQCPFVRGYIDKHPEYSALLKA